jgi:hypothetical protein
LKTGTRGEYLGPIYMLMGSGKDSIMKKFHSIYSSPNIARVIKSRRLRWAGYVARLEECRSAFKILTGKPAGNRPLGRPRRGWQENIIMDLK